MRDRGWIVLAWATVLSALWLACSVVPVDGEESCALAGGDWNEAWSRCYP